MTSRIIAGAATQIRDGFVLASLSLLIPATVGKLHDARHLLQARRSMAGFLNSIDSRGILARHVDAWHDVHGLSVTRESNG